MALVDPIFRAAEWRAFTRYIPQMLGAGPAVAR